MFFKKQKIGKLYVIRLTLPDNTIVHKIGMCYSDRSVDRMMEILRSWFTYFRFVPYTELKLDLTSERPQALEKHIHNVLKSNRFIPNHKVEGDTEMFMDIHEDKLLTYIKACEASYFTEYPKLNEKEASIICKLLTI